MAPGGAPLHPVAMQERPIRLVLELSLDGDSLSGRLTDEAGATVEIVGRIGLLAAIDALARPETANGRHRPRSELPSADRHK